MTHMHHDHSGGLTRVDSTGNLVSKFPNAKIIVNDVEWYEMRNPNNRTRGTYLKENLGTDSRSSYNLLRFD